MNDTKIIDNFLEKHFQEIINNGKNICCVCHHSLDTHIDEGDIWRCHSLGTDAYQCECSLRKKRSENDISYYDLSLRVKEQLEELKGQTKT